MIALEIERSWSARENGSHRPGVPLERSTNKRTKNENRGAQKNLRSGFGGSGCSGLPMVIPSTTMLPVTKNTRMEVYAFKLPADLVERLDAHATRLRDESPGVRITRADALRTLLISALDSVESKPSSKGRH